jgi:hypothetical protein
VGAVIKQPFGSSRSNLIYTPHPTNSASALAPRRPLRPRHRSLPAYGKSAALSENFFLVVAARFNTKGLATSSPGLIHGRTSRLPSTTNQWQTGHAAHRFSLRTTTGDGIHAPNSSARGWAPPAGRLAWPSPPWPAIND